MKFNTEFVDPDNQKLTIEIDNLTEAQAKSIEELMAVWQFISDKKFMYWTAFAIDGWLDWKPVIKVNGKDPERYMEDIGNRSGKIKVLQEDGSYADEEMYFMDYIKVQNKINEKRKNGSEDSSDVA